MIEALVAFGFFIGIIAIPSLVLRFFDPPVKTIPPPDPEESVF